jgi:hypothetical protein
MDTMWHQMKSNVLSSKVFLQNGGEFVVKALELGSESSRNAAVVDGLEFFKDDGFGCAWMLLLL